MGRLTIVGLGFALVACGNKTPEDSGAPTDTDTETDTDTDTDADTDTDTDADADVVYVRAGESGDGSSWDAALGSLQDGLSLAESAGIDSIWVAAGTYTPTTGSDRDASFHLVAGVSVLGGFAGDESAEADRDWANNLTILSGEIGGAAADDNSYHVLWGATDAVLDGFIIEGGYAQDAANPQGEAADILAIDPGFEDSELLRVLNGYATNAGGGMINIQAAPLVQNCTFRDNYGQKGGAVYNMVADTYPAPLGADNDAATFSNVIFENNDSPGRGGAVNNDLWTSPTFIDCQFLNNNCDQKGGGIYNDANCNPTVVNTLFAGNTAERGAAMANDGSSSPLLVWVTYVDNVASDLGAALYQGTYMGPTNYPHLRASIIIGNDSASSSSSISNWHDDAVDTDVLSFVEAVEGTADLDATLVNASGGDYNPTAANADIGWTDGRDTTGWDLLLADAVDQTIPAYPYDTTPAVGGGGNNLRVSLTGDNSDGLSWPTAYTSFGAALDVAEDGDEIWVMAGTYYPTADITDREAAFVLRDGVTVRGGFCGGDNAPGDRVITAANQLTFACETILSGNIDQDPMTGAGVNSYHVVVGAKGAMLDGLIVEDGFADGEYHYGRGGGLIAYEDSSPDLDSCLFRNNAAVEGGALMVYANQATSPDANMECGDFDQLDYPAIHTTYFEGNTAERGGAALFRVAVSADIADSVFTDNTATDRAGALYIDYGGCTEVNDSRFERNTSAAHGGAVYLDDNASQFPPTDATFAMCTFTDNAAGSIGGGLFVHDGADATISVTAPGTYFSGNFAPDGGGAFGVGPLSIVTHSPLADLGVTIGALGDNDVYVDASGQTIEL